MNVRSRALRTAVLCLSALALASCADVHPGSAAVVEGKSISMDEIEKASTAYCELGLAVAQQQGVTAVAKSETRRQAVADRISYEVARQVAEDRSLDIDKNSYAVTADQEAQIGQAFPGADQDQLKTAIARSQETYAIIVALGQKATGKTVTDANRAEIEEAGQAELSAVYAKYDIDIDPRFGLDDSARQVSATGSLSVPESVEPVDASALPASQRCP